jgi:glycosyltransferase involved in cell wall biosynthesis
LARISAKIAGSFGAKRLHQKWGFTQQIEVLPQMSVQLALSPRFLHRDKDAFRVCFVGRLVPDKGVDCLLRAVAGMHRDGLPIECAIAGEGPELDRLSVLARELGIWALVHFRGRLHGDGVRKLLRSSDVLVLPSRRTKNWEEQFGLVLAEAMAEATVTVGSRTGAIPEIIGINDLLFDEDDVQGLTRILARLATDDGFFLWHQVHLWQQARERFSTDRVAAQKVQYLQSVLEKVRAARSGFATGLHEAGSVENPSFAQSI